MCTIYIYIHTHTLYMYIHTYTHIYAHTDMQCIYGIKMSLGTIKGKNLKRRGAYKNKIEKHWYKNILVRAK